MVRHLLSKTFQGRRRRRRRSRRRRRRMRRRRRRRDSAAPPSKGIVTNTVKGYIGYREVTVDRNTPQKHRLEHRPKGAGKPPENQGKTTTTSKTHGNSGTLPQHIGFCISALAVPSMCLCD